MKTNDIKKGMRIKMRNGWEGTMKDNMRGNIRMAEIEGFVTEIGSVYAHDIVWVKPTALDGKWIPVEYTPAQIKLCKAVERYLPNTDV